MSNSRLVVVVAAVAALLVTGFAGAATAKTRHRHHPHKQPRATARLHKGAHRLPRPPADSTPPNSLEPQLQITAPHAAAEPEPSAAPPPAQLEAPPVSAHVAVASSVPSSSSSSSSAAPLGVAPQPASLDLPRSSAAPEPALLATVPAPPRHSHADLERRRRWGLLGGGLAMFLVGYGADIGLTYGLNHQPATSSLIPIAGPLVQLRDSWAMVAPASTGNPQVDNQANPRIAAVNGEIQTAAYAALAIDCAIQVVGAGLTVAGVVGQKRARFAAIEPGGGGVRVRF